MYYIPLVVQWKENYFCRFTRYYELRRALLFPKKESSSQFVVYRECNEDRSSEAAMRGARSAPICKLLSSKRRVRAAHGLNHKRPDNTHKIGPTDVWGGSGMKLQFKMDYVICTCTSFIILLCIKPLLF